MDGVPRGAASFELVCQPKAVAMATGSFDVQRWQIKHFGKVGVQFASCSASNRSCNNLRTCFRFRDPKKDHCERCRVEEVTFCSRSDADRIKLIRCAEQQLACIQHGRINPIRGVVVWRSRFDG